MDTRQQHIKYSFILEIRIAKLRKIEYPTEAEIEELKEARIRVSEINDWLDSEGSEIDDPCK